MGSDACVQRLRVFYLQGIKQAVDDAVSVKSSLQSDASPTRRVGYHQLDTELFDDRIEWRCKQFWENMIRPRYGGTVQIR
jgi:hypothetical protein